MKLTASVVFPLLVILPALAPREALAAFPPEEKRAWEITEGPAVPFEEEEEEDLFQIFREGEIVFTAKVDSVRSQDASLTQIPAPVIWIHFKEIQMLKGEKPRDTAFRYPKPPETLKIPRSPKVLVVLDQKDPKSKTLQITKITRATQAKLDLARLAAEG